MLILFTAHALSLVCVRMGVCGYVHMYLHVRICVGEHNVHGHAVGFPLCLTVFDSM